MDVNGPVFGSGRQAGTITCCGSISGIRLENPTKGDTVELFLIWLGMGVVAAVIANGKGANGCLWFILGFVFGPFALIAALFVPGKECPHCKSKIHKTATVCPKCQREFPAQCPHCENEIHTDATVSQRDLPPPSPSVRKCPGCKNFVPGKATVCPYCQRDLPVEPQK